MAKIVKAVGRPLWVAANRPPLSAATTAMARAYLRSEWPGFERIILSRVGGLYTMRPGAGFATTRGKVHGLLMRLDLSYWPDRWAYLLGRYYELHAELLFAAALRPGDTFVDVGANVGMSMLSAASAMGRRGRIECFEPNPPVYRRLAEHVQLNGLEQLVRTHNAGLGVEPDELTLSIPDGHTGGASLGRMADGEARVIERVRVSVVRGDDALSDLPNVPTFLKIDVEGFEPLVLDGLPALLRDRRPAVFLETRRENLVRAGATPEDLYARMSALGYSGYSLVAQLGPRLSKHRLLIVPTACPAEQIGEDTLWLVPGSEYERRLQPLIASRANIRPDRLTTLR